MLGSLATFGYADKHLKVMWELEGVMVVNSAALIVDTRMFPCCSWSPQWDHAALVARWGTRYQWRGDWLGNRNYQRQGQGIRLADPVRGIPWLIEQLEAGTTLILLCACSTYQTCHRKVLYEQVRARLKGRLPEYCLGQRVETSCGPGVIDPGVPLEVQRARNRYAVLLDRHDRGYFFPHEIQPSGVSQPVGIIEEGRKSYAHDL